MTSISIRQARQRFASLPPALQDIIFSYHVAEIIKNIGEANHLPQDRISAVADAAGIALLGFIHIEELPKEIQERAQVPPEIAKNIAASVENRILNSVRSDLERVYAPAPPEPTKLENVTNPPPPAGEIPKPPAPAPTGSPPAPQKPAEPAPKLFINLDSLNKVNQPASPAAPPATAVSGRKSPAEPSVPIPPLTPAPAAKTPPAPLPSTPPAPAPVFLKRKLELEPLKPETNIRLESTSPSQFGTGKSQIPQPPRPARLEIGQAPLQNPDAAGPGKPIRTEMTPPRVVNYGQWKTPTAKTEAPKPPSPPAPPSSVKPSAPPPPVPPPPPAK